MKLTKCGVHVWHLQKTPFPCEGWVIRAVLYTMQFSINTAWKTQPTSPSQDFSTFFLLLSYSFARKPAVFSLVCDPGPFPVEKVLENLVCYSPTPLFFTNGTQSRSVLDFINLILAVGKLYLVSFWFGWNLPLLQLMNMRLVLGCLPPISIGELSRVHCYIHWCRREESYVPQLSFHYRPEGCDLFPVSLLETEVFISAFHWEKCLIVNISELFQYKCSNLDRLELFGFLTHAWHHFGNKKHFGQPVRESAENSCWNVMLLCSILCDSSWQDAC